MSTHKTDERITSVEVDTGEMGNTNPNQPPKGGKGKPKPKPRKPPQQAKDDPKPANPAPIRSGALFPEGNKVLESYGLSLSGRKERVLSTVKTEQYFKFVELSWSQLVEAKPDIVQRFSLAEWRHAHALLLYGRIENVKFDALGIKPSAPTRIPLPRNLRVFQPIWSVLASVGTVEDDELGVIYIPDAMLPTSLEANSDLDIEGLLTCFQFDWNESWNDVLSKRSLREGYDQRIGVTIGKDPTKESKTLSQQTRSEMISEIQFVRKRIAELRKLIDDNKIEHDSDDESSVTDEEREIANLRLRLDELFVSAKADKKERIRPMENLLPNVTCYSVTDDEIVATPGAYGAWLHWDPKLWIEYNQLVEQLSLVSMFSLSMPNETTGSYSWLLPTESKNSDVFARLPKKSIATPVWIMSLLIQMSTLPLSRRSTWYIESDSLSNTIGITLRYIKAAIKRGSPVEQYGTY
jgi:hypothetical protein